MVSSEIIVNMSSASIIIKVLMGLERFPSSGFEVILILQLYVEIRRTFGFGVTDQATEK